MKRIIYFLIFSTTLCVNAQTKLPYPVIFIHGLIGNSGTWSTMGNYLESSYGLTFGGRMNFCLNSDYDRTYSLFSNDYTDFTATYNSSNISQADYYTVNFDVTPEGYSFDSPSYYDLYSNQSAIFKQGRAVRDAIKHVLNITKKDKVILVGHSMGGLASREYLSNPEIWQTNGKHHVAKLFSNATPHGGSNTHDPTGLINSWKNLDAQSEAVRDLKSWYDDIFGDFTGYGAYLFGEVESNSKMYYNLLYNYRNVDVNCNGYMGDTIVGLYSKYSPADVYYTCAIGEGKGLLNGGTDAFGKTDNTGDGIVGSKRANMNNYMYLRPPLQFAADTFNTKINTSFEFHTEMTKLINLNMKGLDEPDMLNLAYQIDTGKTYLGFSTQPSQASNHSSYDYDAYKFYLPNTNRVKITINDPSASMTYGIIDSTTKNVLFSMTVDKLKTDTTIQLPSSGLYYLAIITDMYLYDLISFSSYTYKLTALPSIITSLQENVIVDKVNEVSIYPNPAQNLINVNSNGNCTLRIISLQGVQIATYQFDNSKSIDVSNYAKGIYVFEVQNGNSVQRKTVIVQ